MVLGFPSNQFGAQDPGTAAEIGAFCEKNFGVSFPIFAKIDVNGPHAHPLYRFLKQAGPGILGFFSVQRIQWNLTQIPGRPEGNVVGRFGACREPMSLAAPIEKLLDGG